MIDPISRLSGPETSLPQVGREVNYRRRADEAPRLFSEAWRMLEAWEKPLLTAYGKADPVLGWADRLFQRYVPGAQGQPHIEFPDGGHFIQEQYPDELVEAITGLAGRL